MRTALLQVKHQLGDDAVIMSNKKVAGGIEIVAAVDNETAAARSAAKKHRSLVKVMLRLLRIKTLLSVNSAR